MLLLLLLSAAVRRLGRLAVSCACAAVLATPGLASAAPASPPDPVLPSGAQVADLAQQYVGSRYAWGGSSPSGFDCTGFVKWVFSQFGVDLPHDEAGQLASGEREDSDHLRPGDVLVFANTYRRGLSHVGIYVGDGHFVHAMDESHGVMISNLGDGYWMQRFVGASRAIGTG